MRKLIAKKAKGGGEIVAPPEAPKTVVTDLMEALKASLAGAGESKSNGHAKSNGHGKASGQTKRATRTAGKSGHGAKSARAARTRPHTARGASRGSAKRAHR